MADVTADSTTGSRAARAQTLPRAGRDRETGPVRTPAPTETIARVQRKTTIRRIEPWSVLKLSLIFNSVALAAFMLLLVTGWTLLEQLGVVDSVLGFAADMQFRVVIEEGNIARAVFLVGLLMVIFGSLVNLFLCFLYNLVGDLLGGLRVTLESQD